MNGCINNDPSTLLKVKSEVSDEPPDLTTSSDCKNVTFKQISCDLENKMCDSINDDNTEFKSAVMQTDCKVVEASNAPPSGDLCTNESLQLRNVTDSKTLDAVKNIKLKSPNGNHSEKLNMVSSDDTGIQCNKDNSLYSSKSVCNDKKNNIHFLCANADEMTLDKNLKQIQSESKLSEEEINVLYKDNSPASVTCDSTKDNCTNSVSRCTDKNTSVISVNNTQDIISVSSDCNKDTIDSGDNFSKNTLTDANTVDSESICGKSSDVNVLAKSSEISNLDSDSSQLSSKNSSLVNTASTSATQKRKVCINTDSISKSCKEVVFLSYM